LSTPALVEMTSTTIFRRVTVTTSKGRQPSSRPLSSTSWPRIAYSKLTRTIRKFCVRRIHVKEPDQMANQARLRPIAMVENQVCQFSHSGSRRPCHILHSGFEFDAEMFILVRCQYADQQAQCVEAQHFERPPLPSL
jgi:hypothetical protein